MGYLRRLMTMLVGEAGEVLRPPAWRIRGSLGILVEKPGRAGKQREV